MTNDIARSACPPPAIDVRGLRKSYAGRVVVDGLDLQVGNGEIVGLIGANGAGKTTTVECLQALRQPDAGYLRVLGMDPIRDAERLRPMIGSQLQDSGLPDRLRVAEAIDLFATERARDGGELLERFGLAARRRSPFAGLSGGERQRLFLVLALLNRPRLVILDELTQGLDPSARREVWAAVATLHAEGTTVLLVTHEMEEAQRLCKRVIAMRSGRILDEGTPVELVARHAPWALVSFGAGRDADALCRDLRVLPGVAEVLERSGRVEIRGERRSIAHVGGTLLRHGLAPDDIDVTLPDLETALLHLLDSAESTGPATSPQHSSAHSSAHPAGASR